MNEMQDSLDYTKNFRKNEQKKEWEKMIDSYF